MAKRKMSEEARKRISEAAKARWAAYRSGDKSVKRPGRKKGAKMGPKMGGKPGRPPKSASGVSSVSGYALADLIKLRRVIDQELADRMVRQQA